MSEPTTNPRVPRSLVEGVLGEQAARSMDTANRIAERNAISEARRDRIKNTAHTVSSVAFALAMTFGLAMACLEIWNSVVG